MKNVFSLLATACASLIFITLLHSDIHADDSTGVNKDILIQEEDLTITRKDVLLMISEMSWAQKQQILKNEDKFQGLLLDFLALKKQEKEAKKRKLDQDPLVQWKIKKQNSQLLAREMISDFRDNIEIPKSIEDVARDYYDANPEKYKIEERVGVSHILLMVKKDADERVSEETLKKANEIIKEIKAGLDFEEAAKKYSEDKGSASDGGIINAFPRGKMVPPFEKAAFAMENIGDISEPIKTRFGYHIIKLTSRIPEGLIPYSNIGPKLIKKERDKFLKSKTDEFLTQFNANKNTTIYLPALQLLLKEESSKLVNPLNKK